MSKSVLLSTRAQREYSKLSKQTRRRVKASLYELASGKKKKDIKKIKGTKGREDLYRLRVGNYRITYKPERLVIKVIRIDPRGTDYGWLD